MSKEYRQTKRVKPNIDIEIVDMIVGTKLGEILNISSTGILLSCNTDIAKGEMFQTQWQFSTRGLKNISVGLECLWSDIQYTNVNLCGFFIIDISQDDQNILDRIIAQSKEIDD